jgi:arylformamidase
MFISLTYPLAEDTPTFGKNPKVKFEPVRRTARGDANNVTMCHLLTHHGTHMDAPFHFNPEGITIDQLSLDDCIFNRPKFIDARNHAGEVIDRSDIAPFFTRNDNSDLLLIFSGISLIRESNPGNYMLRYPPFTTDAAKFIIEETQLRGLAMDFGCVDLAEDIFAGRSPVHDILLGKRGAASHGIPLIEDANLYPLMDTKIKRVFAMPLPLRGLDGSPINLFAEIE